MHIARARSPGAATEDGWGPADTASRTFRQLVDVLEGIRT